MVQHHQQLTILFVALLAGGTSFDFSNEKKAFYREKVKSMFYHAYNGYLNFAYPRDELKPISCTGQDTWGSYSLTLVDSLDMLLILGNETEFERAIEIIFENLDTDRNMNISVFETNIRIIGGLLSAHMLSSHAQDMLLPDGWPCSGHLLDLAERFAQRLLPAFNTYTGMPYGTVNLKYGVNNLETPITCTAGIGTFILEFGTLSRLTGNPHYERVALRALDSLWASRSKLGLVGNHIDVQTGIFTATDSGIGAGVDSYFEYLVKGALLFQRPNLMKQFYEFEEAINKHVRKEDWFMWVDKDKAIVSLPIFQSLEAFWPGLLALVGKVEDAARIMASYGQILRHLGLAPEFYNLPNRESVQRRAAYPLRPEIAESLMYLYRATKDPAYLKIATEIVDAIDQMARTKCGFATVRDVTTWTLEDRMESFFLAETTKYLYLIFDEDNFIHNDGTKAKLVETTDGPCMIEAAGWIFNTEAHPLDPGIVYCCSKKRNKDRQMLQEFEENIDFIGLTGQFGEFEGADEEDAIADREGSNYINEEQQHYIQGWEREADKGHFQKINNQIKSIDDPSNHSSADDQMATISKAILRIFEKAELKLTQVGTKSDRNEKKSTNEEMGVGIGVAMVCQDCCTRADEPGAGNNLNQFWLAIYINYFHFNFLYDPVCWDWDGDGQVPSMDDGSQYWNNVPDLALLRSDYQYLDAAAQFSLVKFKYSNMPAGLEDETNFTLLTTPNKPFERFFLGIGQIVQN